VRVPSFERFQRISAAAALFICGLVVGAAVFNGLNHAALSNAIDENYKLREQAENHQDQINRLNEDLGKESVIQAVVVYIEEPAGKPSVDVVTEKELKRQLKQDLSVFRGRKIYTIGRDAPFTRKVLEKKIYSDIGQNDYKVRITTMLVADGVLQVWVEVSKAALRP
jgi:hypothetical protein